MTNEDFKRAKEIIEYIDYLEKQIELTEKMNYPNSKILVHGYDPNDQFKVGLPEELILPIKEKVLRYYNKELAFWNKELKKL
jgi:hypothetical protein